MDQVDLTRPHAEVRGGWFFVRSPASTTAFRLNADDEVHVDGELHEQLWRCPDRVLPVASLLSGMSDAVRARTKPGETLSVGSILRGQGWGLLFVELTGRCNERCVHCYAGSSPDVDEALSREQVLAVVSEARALGFSAIQFTGGDPLLSPHLVEALRHAREEGIPHVEVYTNGLALRPNVAEVIASCGAKMALSVYSHLPEVHDGITGSPGSLQRTLSAIKLARSLKIDVRVGVVLREGNIDHAGEIRRLLVAHGVSPEKVGIDRERPVGRGRWQSEHEPPETAWDPGAGGQPGESSLHSLSRQEPGTGKLAITYDGYVAPCIFDRSTRIGSIDQSDLRTILEREVHFRGERKQQLPVVGEALACGDCRARRRLLERLGY